VLLLHTFRQPFLGIKVFEVLWHHQLRLCSELFLLLKNELFLSQILKICPYFLFVCISQHLDITKIIVVAIDHEPFPAGEQMRSKAIDDLFIIASLEYFIDCCNQALYTCGIDHEGIVVLVYSVVDVSLELRKITLKRKFSQAAKYCIFFIHDFVFELDEA